MTNKDISPQQKRFSIFNIITIILLFSTLALGSYTWVNQQSLEEFDEKVSSLQKNYQTTNSKVDSSLTKLTNFQAKINAIDESISSLKAENQNLSTKLTTAETKFNEQTQLQPQLPADPTNHSFKPLDSSKFLGFDKLFGFQQPKQLANKFLNYINHPENYQGLGKITSPKGMLLYGPPGTGKTTFARALAKESNLPFIETSASEFSCGIMGEAPQKVKDLFGDARNIAEQNKKGCIIFIDECEEIFKDLTSTDNSSKDLSNVVNQFKSELTSPSNNPSHPVFLIAATNHFNKIDTAIKDRLTYKIEVQTLSKEDRVKFINFMINCRQNPYSDNAKNYFTQYLNEVLDHYNGEAEHLKSNRTIENIMEETIQITAGKQLAADEKREVTVSDLQTAYKNVVDQNVEFDTPNGLIKLISPQTKQPLITFDLNLKQLTKYKYNANNQLIKETFYNFNDSKKIKSNRILNNKIFETFQFYYNHPNKTLSQVDKSSSNCPNIITTHYDEFGNVTAAVGQSPNGA